MKRTFNDPGPYRPPSLGLIAHPISDYHKLAGPARRDANRRPYRPRHPAAVVVQRLFRRRRWTSRPFIGCDRHENSCSFTPELVASCKLIRFKSDQVRLHPISEYILEPRFDAKPLHLRPHFLEVLRLVVKIVHL